MCFLYFSNGFTFILLINSLYFNQLDSLKINYYNLYILVFKTSKKEKYINYNYLAMVTIREATPITTETTEKTILVAAPTPAPLALVLLGST